MNTRFRRDSPDAITFVPFRDDPGINNIMKKLIIAAIFIAAGLGSAAAQTAADLDNKFGKRESFDTVSGFSEIDDKPYITAHPAGPDIWMVPRFDGDGQVCQVLLFLRDRGNDRTLPFEKFAAIVDYLTPFDSRGPAEETNFAATATGGGSLWTTFNFEKVHITYSSTFQFTLSENRREFKFSEEYAKYPPDPDAKPAPKPPFKPTAQEVSDRFKGRLYQGAAVQWTGRKCSGDEMISLL